VSSMTLLSWQSNAQRMQNVLREACSVNANAKLDLYRQLKVIASKCLGQNVKWIRTATELDRNNFAYY
jgi:hypothetical protein